MKPIKPFLHLTAGLAFLAGAICLHAQSTTTNSARPGIAFSETTFDLGKVSANDSPRHEFIVTNTGNATLEISGVAAGCPGCTQVGQWTRTIEPGKTGVIPVQLRLLGFNGSISKQVTVTCNDPVHPTHTLNLNAFVFRPFEAIPQYLSFIVVDDDTTNETKSVRITNNQDQDMAIEKIVSTNPTFVTELRTNRPGREFELLVTCVPQPGNTAQQGQILINKAGDPAPVIVTAMLTPQRALQIASSVLHLAPGQIPPQYCARQITVQNNSRTPLALSDPKVNADGATVQLQELKPGHTFVFNVTFPTNFVVASNQVIEVSAKTSHPKLPILKATVIQVDKPN